VNRHPLLERFRHLPTVGSQGHAPGSPGPVAGYDLDANRILLPEHVRQMPAKARKAWMDSHGLVPAIGGGAGYGSTFLQMLEPFQVADGSPLGTSTTETVISYDSLLTLPPNFFANPGKMIWCRWMGKVSNIVTTPGTITFAVRYNTITGTVLATTGPINFNTVAATDNLWYVEFIAQCLANSGTTTGLTLLSYGEAYVANTLGGAADIRNASMPPGGTALANVTGLDGTVGKALSLTAKFSISNAANIITNRNAWIIALN
jgi:hypothetical protein